MRFHGLLADVGEQETIPQEFLMDMMDINEKIMELEFDPSPTLYQEAVAASNSLESSLEASVGAILSKWTAATGTEAELAAAKAYFLKKKYLLRVKENLSKFAPAYE